MGGWMACLWDFRFSIVSGNLNFIYPHVFVLVREGKALEMRG